VAEVARGGTNDADAAVAAARRAFEGWRDTPASERAAVLLRAAEWLRARRDEVAALEIFEVGKPWREADADVCEAIDFLEYYGARCCGSASRASSATFPVRTTSSSTRDAASRW
jgi:RHH-type proline utilization regulon transcriptional repressor/proline dehydrogenase/delta 1-pyrroline-5-carboxylate dehydrogenase